MTSTIIWFTKQMQRNRLFMNFWIKQWMVVNVYMVHVLFTLIILLLTHTEIDKKEYSSLIASFKAAWALVGHKLKYHGW